MKERRPDCYSCRRILTDLNCTRHNVEGVMYWNRRCNACRAAREKLTPLMQEKLKLVADVKNKPCCDCGGRFDPVCMEFDHLDHTQKSFLLSTDARWKSIAVIKAEIAKCEVVCANCHRVRTFKTRKFRGGRPPRLARCAPESEAPNEAFVGEANIISGIPE